MRTLIRSFSGVASDVSLKLAEFNTCVITLWTLVRFFVRVTVSNMSYQLSRCCKSRFAVLTQMRFGSSMRVDVIGQTGDCFKSALADVALVRSKINKNC